MRSLYISLLASFTIFHLGASPLLATDRFVATTGSDTGNDCSSVASPCASLTRAVSEASAGDEIKVQQGMYTEGAEVLIDKNLTVRGDYDTNFDLPQSPDATRTVFHGSDTHRVMQINNAAVVSLDRLRLTAGVATSTAPNGNGGGLIVTGAATVNCDNMQVDDSFASTSTAAKGGGIAIVSGSSFICEDLVVSGNIAGSGSSAFGGGIYITESTAELTRATVTGNMATRTSMGFGSGIGGGIYYRDIGGLNSLMIVSSTIEDNIATKNGGTLARGGGIFVAGDFSATIMDSTISGNVARAADDAVAGTTSNLGPALGGGVGVANTTDSGTLTIQRCKITENIANEKGADPMGSDPSTGGGISVDSSNTFGELTVIIENSEISDNIARKGNGPEANTRGGGLYLRHSDVTILNSQVLRNQVVQKVDPGDSTGIGGGLHFREPLNNNQGLEVTNTIFGSNVDSDQVYVALNTGVSTTATFNHCTFADTSRQSNGIEYFAVGNDDGLTVSNSIFSKQLVAIENSGGTNDVVTDTLLYFDNQSEFTGTVTTSGTNVTGDPDFVDPSNGDFHIAGSSAAIDKAKSSALTEDLDEELRPQGDGPDIGADEYSIADLSLQKSVSVSSGVAVGEEVIYTITVSNAGPGVAKNVVVTDTLPAELQYLSDDSDCDEMDSTVTCQIGDLIVDDSVVIKITVSVVELATIINSAQVATDSGDKNQTNNTDSATINSSEDLSAQVAQAVTAALEAFTLASKPLPARGEAALSKKQVKKIKKKRKKILAARQQFNAQLESLLELAKVFQDDLSEILPEFTSENVQQILKLRRKVYSKRLSKKVRNKAKRQLRRLLVSLSS